MKTCSSTFLIENDILWEPAGEGVTRQILGFDGQLMMVKVLFTEGAKGYVHAHHHSQTTFVASGKFAFTIGEETKIVTTGDGLYMEPDVEHGCECLEAGMLIDCFNPMRADFIK